MTWKVAYYGKEDPSLTRKISIHCLMTSFALFAYGAWTDFIPSSGWRSFGLSLTIVTTFFISALIYWAYYTGRLTTQPDITKWRRRISLLFLPGFIFIFFWSGLVHALPDLVTLVIGKTHKEQVMLTKSHHSSRRSCDYRLEGQALENAFPGYICISSSSYNRFPNTESQTVLEEKVSTFGFHVQRIYDDSPVHE